MQQPATPGSGVSPQTLVQPVEVPVDPMCVALLCTGWSVRRGPDTEASHYPGCGPWGEAPPIPRATARVRTPGLPAERRGGRQEVCQQRN